MTVSVATYAAAVVRAAEQPLLADGVPLMQKASSALAWVASELIAEADAARVLVLVGSGDNGGDALFAAATLAESARVDLLLTSARRHEEGFAAATDAGAQQITIDDLHDADAYDLIIDGILGIGAAADPALRGDARTAVELLLPAVRAQGICVIAVDLPSGLHPDTGEADDVVLPATTTVTFGAVKSGLSRERASRLVGGLVLVDIGLGEGLARAERTGAASIDRIISA